MANNVVQPGQMQEPGELLDPEKGSRFEQYKVDGVYEYGIKNGKKDKSRVRVTYYEGDIFEGTLRHRKYVGFGKYSWKNGGIYEGTFKKGKLNGKGKYTEANGETYEGEFKNNKYNGAGKYTWADGSTFDGVFKNGQIISGRFTDAEGNLYSCSFKYKRKGKKDKFIISTIDGKWTSSKEPNKWVTFEAALKYARENNCEGLSLLLDKKYGITCIDLDKCYLNAETGEKKERATKLLEELKGTYIERSTSGNGIHIFLKDDILKGGIYNSTSMVKDEDPRGDLEVYDDKRIISMTGDIFLHHSLEDKNDEPKPVNGEEQAEKVIPPKMTEDTRKKLYAELFERQLAEELGKLKDKISEPDFQRLTAAGFAEKIVILDELAEAATLSGNLFLAMQIENIISFLKHSSNFSVKEA